MNKKYKLVAIPHSYAEPRKINIYDEDGTTLIFSIYVDRMIGTHGWPFCPEEINVAILVRDNFFLFYNNITMATE